MKTRKKRLRTGKFLNLSVEFVRLMHLFYHGDHYNQARTVIFKEVKTRKHAMAATITNVKVQYLSPNVFGSSLGQIIYTPKESEREPTLQSDSFKFYGGIALMNIKNVFELGICTFNQRELETDQLEQHALTQELLFAIDGDFIMPVAPIIQKSGESWPDLDHLVAIRVRMGEGVVFNDGIWHWAPFPLKKSSSVIVGFEKDTADKDLVIRDLDSRIVMEQ